MVLADTMAIFLVIVGLLICFNAIWLFCRAIWEPLIVGAREAHYNGMVKSFFLGLPLTALTVIVFGALANDKQGPWGLVAILIAGVYLLFASIGVAAMAELIGDRLGGETAGQAPWRCTVRGGSVLVLSFLFPFLGWLLILPVATIVGCGAAIRALFHEWKGGKGERDKRIEQMARQALTEPSVDCSGA
ncbi:MAG: hypothetical protein K2X93_04390 [Candidatus Obscuribacterales bacterium]|nr:hypothetical protein [Candidatus Obscuribacterales bacterium]